MRVLYLTGSILGGLWLNKKKGIALFTCWPDKYVAITDNTESTSNVSNLECDSHSTVTHHLLCLGIIKRQLNIGSLKPLYFTCYARVNVTTYFVSA